MSYGFFGMSSPREMLDKAKRELSKMKSDLNPDTIFNFFVTTYHVMDYVKTATRVPSPSAIKDMYDDEDFKMCQFVCNQGKHSILRTVTPYSAFADGPSGGDVIYEIVDGSNRAAVLHLGDKLIAKWEKFFLDNAIS